jgi:drug/metabolite transporter (DMT)-like permease
LANDAVPKKSERSLVLGYLAALGAAVLSGLMPSISKPILLNVNPLFFTAIVTLAPAALFTPVSMRSTENKRLKKNGYFFLVAAAICGSLLGVYLYFVGLQQTTASDAALLANGEMVFTVLIASIFFGERLSRKGKFSLIIIAVGIVTVITNLQFSASLSTLFEPGNLLILAATLLWGIDNNLTSAISQRVNVARIIQLKALISGIGLMAVALAAQMATTNSLSSLIQVIAFGLVIFSGAVFLSVETLKRLGAITTTIVFPINSIFGLVFAFVLLAENISLLQIFSVFLMLFGIYMLTRKGSVTRQGINLEQF